MSQSTKQQILTNLDNLTENFDFASMKIFTAYSISDDMHISRSLASQYLNEMVKEGLLIKINSRPVYFLHRKKMESLFKITFQEDDYYDLEDLKEYLKKHSKDQNNYLNIIGSDKSLANLIKSLQEALEYPPQGLPVILYGERGTGKRLIIQTMITNLTRTGILNEFIKLIKVEISNTNNEAVINYLFTQGNHLGELDKYEQIVLLICGGQNMSFEFQEKLCEYMENSKSNHFNKNKNIRYIILSEVSPEVFVNERLLKNIPLILNTTNLEERGNEEKEELIVHLIRMESKKMNREIKISNAVLRALVHGNFKHNIIGLKSTIQIMCASSLKDNIKNGALIVHTYHLPEHLLKTLPIVINEEIVYIDTSIYSKSKEVDYLLDYFNQIIKPFSKHIEMTKKLEESKQYIDLLSDYLSYKKQRIPPQNVVGIEVSINNILDIILKKSYVYVPTGFSGTLAKIIYLRELYGSSLQKWRNENLHIIDDVLHQLKNELKYESIIVEEIIRLIKANLEFDTLDILAIVMMIILNHYNSSLSKRKTFGMIVCHGYSTATSIADAVNKLLESYVFEAIDMPLDITLDEIKDTIVSRLNRMYSNADVIIMVDMGSLEQLGNSMSTSINCNVGVINNVSTRLALNIGYGILQDNDIRSNLEKVSSSSKADYTIISRKRNDAILFTSESGIHMAQRMRELFESSFSKHLPLDLAVCDFHQLVTEGGNHEVFNTSNVLFITGTANPKISNQKFIALEDIISSNSIDLISKSLQQYLDPKELNILVSNLRKNFTLQNVVGYLTILNPKVLLDNVSLAIDILQDKMNKQFSGKTLIGIYIHVCCLIERLVTRTAITDYSDLESFKNDFNQFILFVQNSFKSLSKRYNVQIPLSEIAYLHQFIVADTTSNQFNKEDRENNHEEI